MASSTHHDGETRGLGGMAARLRRQFRGFARCFVGSQNPERAPISAPPSLPDEILLEILVLLPPLPSSLPRASLVCKRWRRLVSDPVFLRRFRAHHRTPPLLGFFTSSRMPSFFPALDAPNRIPAARFSPPQGPGEYWAAPLGCRHGLALFLDFSGAQVIVWDPVTGDQRRVPLPVQLVNSRQHAYTGAVLVAAGDNGAGHLHGGNRMSSFKVVLVCGNITQHRRAWTYVYESNSGTWGNVSSTVVPYLSFPGPAVLVGTALCWLLCWSGNAILEFDTERQSMTVTHIPSYTRDIDVADIQVVRTEDGGLGIVVQAKQCIQLWGRKTDLDGYDEWVLQKTVYRDDLLSLKSSVVRHGSKAKWLSGLLGYDEDTNVIVVATEFGTFMVQLDRIELTELFCDQSINKCYPYASFYTGVTGGDDGIEILNDA